MQRERYTPFCCFVGVLFSSSSALLPFTCSRRSPMWDEWSDIWGANWVGFSVHDCASVLAAHTEAVLIHWSFLHRIFRSDGLNQDNAVCSALIETDKMLRVIRPWTSATEFSVAPSSSLSSSSLPLLPHAPHNTPKLFAGVSIWMICYRLSGRESNGKCSDCLSGSTPPQMQWRARLLSMPPQPLLAPASRTSILPEFMQFMVKKMWSSDNPLQFVRAHQSWLTNFASTQSYQMRWYHNWHTLKPIMFDAVLQYVL